MADEKKAAAQVAAPAAAPVVPLAIPAGPLAVMNGMRVKAPAGMEMISVGGLNFTRDGDGFVLPAPLVGAAKAHIKSFVDAAERDEKRMMAELEKLAAEADIPGRIKALEQRLADLEGMLGRGTSRG